MKKTCLFWIIVLFSAIRPFANPITVETAKKVALNWIVEKSDFSNGEIYVTDVLIIKENEINLIYICKLYPQGFVFVSADDIANPIIAYSKKDIYNNFDQPPAFIGMINSAKKDILFAIENQIDSFATIANEWKRLNIDTESFIPITEVKNIDPLLVTTWGQCGGYNIDCPGDGMSICGNDHVPTGCVATAMSQIIRFYCYPVSGNGDHAYYHPDYGNLYANFGVTTYRYESMPLNISGGIDSDIAILMKHCGVSVDMDYGPNSSGASLLAAANALNAYFNYSGAISLKFKRNYSTDDWINLMKNELDNYRPILYGGLNPDTLGHAFILDGFQNNSYFHINWGWDGSYQDVYFNLDDLTPGSHNYNLNQQAIINIYPVETNYGKNQTPESGFVINMPYYELNSIAPAGDVDWYKMLLYSGSTINLFTELSGSSELDTKAWLYGSCTEQGYELLSNPDAYLLAEDDDSHGNLQPEINVNIDNTGYYYLRIAHYENNPSKTKNPKSNVGSYYLHVDASSPGEPDLFLNYTYVPDYIPYDGGNFIIIVGNAGDGTLNWNSQDVPSWVTLNPSNGSTQNTQNVMVNVSQNFTNGGRSCTIDFYNTNNPSDHTWLYIDQLGPGTYIYEEYVSGVWDIAGSPYIICENIDVQEDDELIIDAGVVVKFQEDNDLFIRGILKVNGTSNNRVTFCAENEGNSWDDITIYSPNNHDECYINYADFINGAIEIRGNSLIKGCNFINCTSNNSNVVEIDPVCGGLSQFIDCNFENNTFKRVLEVDYGDFINTPTFTNCTFNNNKNNDNSDAIVNVSGNSRPVFNDCAFWNNSISSDSGDGGAISIEDEGSAFFNNCSFAGNSVHGDGGAVSIDISPQSIPTIPIYFYKCYFNDNIAGEHSGAVHIENENYVIFESCKFTNNSSEDKGGAIGTVHLQGSIYFVNCLFDSNSANNEGNCAYIHSWGGNLLFINSIINETTNIFSNDVNNVYCYYSVIPYGLGGFMYDGCLAVDPDLDENYYPNEGSVCIDAGTHDDSFLPPEFEFSEFDFAGNPRISNGTIDIGIYEIICTNINKNPIIPESIKLYQNSPNPFNQTTTIFFSIPSEAEVKVTIFNLEGQLVKTLVNKKLDVGDYSIIWNGDDEVGNFVDSGIYLYKLTVSGRFEALEKCLLLK